MRSFRDAYIFGTGCIKLLELPVSNVTVSTAIGKKLTSVKKQILIQFEIGDCIVSSIFLVIPFLSSDIILGNNFLLKNGIVIDYWYRRIGIKDKIVSPSVVLFERDCSEKLFSSKGNDGMCIYIIQLNEISCENKINHSQDCIDNTRCNEKLIEIELINEVNHMSEIENQSRDNKNNKNNDLNEIININNSQITPLNNDRNLDIQMRHNEIYQLISNKNESFFEQSRLMRVI